MKVKIENEPRIVVTLTKQEVFEIAKALNILVEKQTVAGPNKPNELLLEFESIINEIEIREITRALKLLVDKRSISGPSELNGLFLNFESIIRELEEEPAAGE